MGCYYVIRPVRTVTGYFFRCHIGYYMSFLYNSFPVVFVTEDTTDIFYSAIILYCVLLPLDGFEYMKLKRYKAIKNGATKHGKE